MSTPVEEKPKSSLILVIEDDSQMRRYLRTVLTNEGYQLIEAITAQEGIRQAGLRHPDLVILDLGLPDRDGLEVARDLREWTMTPIIVLTARSQENDKVTALDIGADDYLTKPFGTNELLARIRAASRHAIQAVQGSEEPLFTVGDLRVDLAYRKVFVGEKEVHLTPIEYQLLLILIQYAGKVVTRRQLLHDVWGPDYVDESHYLRIYMGQLRHKLEADPTRPRYLITEPGVGYRLKVE
jgi:two-component system, OmpR family, KDP operon response regulator KdpE